MNSANRSVALIAILMLFTILLPAVAGLVNFTGGDDLPDDYYLPAGGFAAAWAKMRDYQILSGLMMGMSIFALVVVYLGGRSNHRRFNDRTIGAINLFKGVLFRDGSMNQGRFLFAFDRLQPELTNENLNEDMNLINVLCCKEVGTHARDY
jgi:hypothetical protein